MVLINLTLNTPKAAVRVDCPDIPSDRCAYVNPQAVCAIKSNLEGNGSAILLANGDRIDTHHHPTALYDAIFGKAKL